jgi:hypothetical protein
MTDVGFKHFLQRIEQIANKAQSKEHRMSLNISNNNLSDPSIKVFAGVIENCDCFYSIDMSYLCKLKDATYELLASAFATNKGLSFVNLRGCQF